MKFFHKNLFSVILGLFVAAVFLGLPHLTQAADPDLIDVVEIVGTAPIIVETNILPGDTFSRTVTVKNFTAESQAIIMKLDIDTTQGFFHLPDFKLEKMLFVSIEKPDTTLVTLPGGGTEASLASLDGSVIDLGTVPSLSTSAYEMHIVFDKNAGNEYQETKVYFNLAMSVDAPDATVVTDDGGNGGGGNNNNNKKNNNSPGPSTPTGGTILGLATTPPGGEQGSVEGAATEVGSSPAPAILGAATGICTGGWPLWAWILLLVLHALLFNSRHFWKKNAREINREALKRRQRPLQLVSTVAAVIIWYFFDVCRLYPWVPYVAVIISILSYLVFRRRREDVEGNGSLNP